MVLRGRRSHILLIQALMHIMYKLVQGGPSCEAYCCANKLENLSQYPLVGVSEREYQIPFIYEYIFFPPISSDTHASLCKTPKVSQEKSENLCLSRGLSLLFFLTTEEEEGEEEEEEGRRRRGWK